MRVGRLRGETAMSVVTLAAIKEGYRAVGPGVGDAMLRLFGQGTAFNDAASRPRWQVIDLISGRRSRARKVVAEDLLGGIPSHWQVTRVEPQAFRPAEGSVVVTGHFGAARQVPPVCGSSSGSPSRTSGTCVTAGPCGCATTSTGSICAGIENRARGANCRVIEGAGGRQRGRRPAQRGVGDETTHSRHGGERHRRFERRPAAL